MWKQRIIQGFISWLHKSRVRVEVSHYMLGKLAEVSEKQHSVSTIMLERGGEWGRGGLHILQYKHTGSLNTS